MPTLFRMSMSVTKHPLCAPGPKTDPIPADEALIEMLERSFRRLTQSGTDLADRFYDLLFSRHPELRSMFPQDMSEQKRKLIEKLSLVVDNLRTPRAVREALVELGRGHVAYGARPEQYARVRDALVTAMAAVSGSEWSPELEAEWGRAIGMVSDIMIAAGHSVPEPVTE